MPGWCTFKDDETVLCHVRMIGISGAGLKAADVFGAHGCSQCHKVVDGQIESGLSYDERRLLLLEGMLRTQAYLIKQGILRWD